MLNLYLKDENRLKEQKIEVVEDVEEKFDTLKLRGTPLDKKLIQIIEQGEYNDAYSFIDRFGYRIRIEDMSTGCKAALCVANFESDIIDLSECGWNARDAIISLCKNGNVIIEDDSVTFNNKYIENDKIAVRINGRDFDNVDDLNYYIQNRICF